MIIDVQPDIVHFNSLTLAPYSSVPKELGVPCVLHVREPVLDGFLGLRKAWLRYFLRNKVNKVISICHDNLRRLGSLKNGAVVYNPVDFSRFDFTIEKIKVRRELGLPEDGKIVCYVGGGHPVKGPDYFFDAMLRLHNLGVSFSCVAPSFSLPDIPGRTFFRRIISSILLRRLYSFVLRLRSFYFKLSSVIDIFTPGFTYDVQKYLAASDVVCVTHAKPHFARVVMESGAMKRPVVCFAVGGVSEVVIDGVTGVLVQPRDTDAMAHAVKRIFEDRGFSDSLSENAYDYSVEKFSSSVSARKVFDIYLDVMKNGR